MKILCVEDDQDLAKLLQVTLNKQHYQVELATDGQTGWNLAEAFVYDLILLDLMLPRLDGISFCKKLRYQTYSTPLNPNWDTPVLLMTALDTVRQKVIGLDAGADDYIVKPFNWDELLARIRALGRRKPATRKSLLKWGELCLNPNNCEVTYRGKPVVLAAKEYKLLELFLQNPNQIFNSSRLLDRLWVSEEPPTEGVVRAHMKGLRQKLRQAGLEDAFETIYKLGYRLKPQKIGDKSTQAIINEQLSPSFPQISSKLWAVWQECRQSYCDRLAVIEQAVNALKSGTLTPQQQHEAEQEAHTLIGSLGSFGLDEASRLAGEIQRFLKQKEPLGQMETEQLLELVTSLQQNIQKDISIQEPELCRKQQEQEDEKIHLQPEAFSAFSYPKIPSSAPCLLVVDDDLPLARQIAKEALEWGFQAKIATNLEDARLFLTQNHIDIILLDLIFPGSAENGLDFLATVRHQYPELPVVILTVEESFTKRVEAVRLGSRWFLQKPLTLAQVFSTVSQVLQQANKSAARLLVVDDDPSRLHLLRTWLEPDGYHLVLLDQPQKFWQTLEQAAPDLLILNLELSNAVPSIDKTAKPTVPPLSGIELCQVIRSDLRWNRLPVMLLSAHSDPETIERSFAAGVDDFLSKPVVEKELITRVRNRLEQRQLWGMTEIDELTGLSLRRRAMQDLMRLLQLAQRQQQPFSLAVLDLDHFKRINDEHGHDIGDRVLNHIGKLLNHSFRREDVIGRWGGEEFIIGMYGITKQDCAKRLAVVLDHLHQYQFMDWDGVPFQVTFSAGVAQFPNDGNEVQTLYQSADTVLYQAKAEGRDRILAAW